MDWLICDEDIEKELIIFPFHFLIGCIEEVERLNQWGLLSIFYAILEVRKCNMWKFISAGLGGCLLIFLGIIFYELFYYDQLSATPDFYFFRCLVPCIVGGILAGIASKKMGFEFSENPIFSIPTVFLIMLISMFFSLVLIFVWMFL